MTQANLENYAMNNGITTSIKEMTEAEKVTLRYNYVMDAMADAQGAAKREQDSFNGQIRYFKEQLIEIATRIGEQMMPVLEDLLQKVNKFVEQIAGLDDKGFKNIAVALVGVAAVAPLLLGVGKILGVVQSALMGWAGALKAIKGTKFAAFLAQTFGTATIGPIIGAILAVTGVILAIGIALKQVWDESESFRNAMKEVWANVKHNIEFSIDRIVSAYKSFVYSNRDSIEKAKKVWEGFKDVIEFIATVIGRTIEFISTVVAGLSTIFSGALRDSDKSVKIGLEMIKLAFEKFILQVKTAFYKTDWKGIGKNIMGALYSGISGLAQTLYNLFIKIVNTLVEIAKKIDWVGLGKTVMTFILNGISAISGLLWQTAQKIFNSMLDLIKRIDWLTLGKNVMDFIIKGISALASTLWQVVQKIFYTALDYIKNINWDNLGQTLMRLIINGISTLGSMIWNTLKGIFSGAKNNSEKSIDWLGIGLTIINMIVQGITILMGVIWRTLRGALTEAWHNAKNIDWASIGSAIINGITSRISAIGGNIWNSIRNALNNAKEWASNISWSSVGGSIVNGIVSGITGLADKIYDKIVSAFNTAKSWTSGLWDNITGTGKRSFDMQFNGSVVPNMQRMAMPTMGNYYNPVVATSGHSINISVDARGDNADMIARRVERAIVRRIQS